MFYEQHNQTNRQPEPEAVPYTEAQSVESSAPLIAGFLAYAAAFPVAMAVAAACTLAIN